MDVILDMAIDFACQLQEDARCIAVRQAQDAADKDEELQKLIGEFNLKRMAVNTEESKPEEQRDADKLRQINADLRTVYADIMKNERMTAYNAAKENLDALMSKVNAAIALAIQGQDPHMAAQEGGCSGNCGSCGGCHG